MATNKLMIEIGAKDMASKVFKNLSASTVAFGVALGNLASKAITAGINGLRRWVDEALEAEKANVMLDASLRGIGQYTPQLAQQYRDLANAIQDETGASDEAGKANIALLASLGVMPENMAAAARGVQALNSLNVEGSMAAKAMARALEGDMSGFDRLSAAVRLATTDQEKAVEIGKFLQAGYEQQKASLQTVGGAWQALKGRIGDAREDMLGAIFEGLQLGKTFDGMQASVGAFLKSDTFKNFTDRLKDAAGYALKIAKSFTSKDSGLEMAKAFIGLLDAAFQDGADAVASAIVSGFKKAASSLWDWAGSSKTMQPAPKFNALTGESTVNLMSPEARAARSDENVAKQEIEDKKTRVEKAFERIEALIKSAEQPLEDIADTSKDIADIEDEIAMVDILTLAAKRKKVELENESVVAKMTQNDLQANINHADEEIERAKKAEAEASQNAARNANAAKANAKMGLAEWIANAAKNNADEQAFNQSEAKQRRYIARLEEKQGRGVTLSRRDEKALEAAVRKRNQLGALIGADDAWKKEATDFQKQQGKWEDEKIRLQKLMESHLDSMSKDLKETLKDQ